MAFEDVSAHKLSTCHQMLTKCDECRFCIVLHKRFAIVTVVTVKLGTIEPSKTEKKYTIKWES